MKTQFDSIQNNSSNSGEEFQKKLSAWGEKYKDQFITTRSIESPEEDLAEILSYYITGGTLIPEPSTTVKEKIKFVESQTELVQFKKDFNESFDRIFADIPQS